MKTGMKIQKRKQNCGASSDTCYCIQQKYKKYAWKGSVNSSFLHNAWQSRHHRPSYLRSKVAYILEGKLRHHIDCPTSVWPSPSTKCHQASAPTSSSPAPSLHASRVCQYLIGEPIVGAVCCQVMSVLVFLHEDKYLSDISWRHRSHGPRTNKKQTVITILIRVGVATGTNEKEENADANTWF